MPTLPKEWEVKGPTIWAPDRRTNTLEPLWRIGFATDQERKMAHQVRAVLDPYYAPSFWHWFRLACKSGSSDLAFNMLDLTERKALSEGTDPSGGFLVPPDVQAEIISVVRERSTVRKNARVFPTSRDQLRFGGELDFQAEWTGEAQGGETTVTPIQGFQINVYKIRSKVKLSRDLWTDQPSAQAWLVQAGGDQIALAEDGAFIAGDGSLKPWGFANSKWLPAASIFDIQGSTAHTITSTTANQGSVPKLKNMEASLPDRYRANARWFMSSGTLGDVRGLVSAAGTCEFALMLHPLTGEDCLMSHPVSTSSAMPADNVTGNTPVAFIDLSTYYIATRSVLTARLDFETLGDVDQVLVHLFDRVGGAPTVNDAVRLGQV